MTEALDLFAGAGGWSLACQALGIDEVGVEIMPEAVATRSAAGFKTHETGDVWEFDFPAARGRYDGLIASPPCQTFSTAGKGAGRKALDQVLDLITTGVWKDLADLRQAAVELGDERTALVLTPLHAAWELRPEWIAWEQVPTVLPVWEACAEELRSWGYSVWTGNLQAEMYGVPQTRKRAFLIAHRDREVAPPTPTHSRYYSRSPEKLDEGVEKWVSMAEALGWAERKLRSNYGTGGDASRRGERDESEPAPTVTSKVDRNKWVYRSTDLPNATVRPADTPAPTLVFGHAASSAKWVLRNNNTENAAERELGQPAPTMFFGQRMNYVHGARHRPATTVNADPRISKPGRHDPNVSGSQQKDAVRVTVEEAGVLQSFPADFPWQGSKTKQYLQCGNAVPPLLAHYVLASVS